MKFTSAIAIYFIIWWLTLFVVLPFGIRNSHESGETVEPGNEPGAPTNPQLRRKLAANTLLAAVVFVIVYVLVTQGWFGLDDLPFVNNLRID